MNFEFATATRIVFGAGAVRQVGANVKNFGRRALVVTGARPERAEKLLASLTASGISTAVFSVAGEPDIATVERGVAFAKAEQCEFVVSIGGGSVIDAGKAIAALGANPGDVLDYLEVVGRGRPLPNAPLPFVAVPTTAGTGSEATRNAVLGSPEHGVKASLRSASMLPAVALVDPELTLGLSREITAATGLDALTQLIEPFVCSRANPMTDALCRDGIGMASKALPRVCANGRDAESRAAMSYASLLGGIALANAGLGVVHGFAAPVGGMFPAPHGAVCAALLPYGMAANIRALREREPESAALQRYTEIARILTGYPDAEAEAGAEWAWRLVQGLAIPPLRTYGISAADVDGLVTKASQASSMKANPIALTRPELERVLGAAV